MTKGTSKLVVLGLDAAVPKLLKKFMSEGYLPNIRKLTENGVFTKHITTFPTLTAPAWAAISTGAAIGTAGIPSLTVKNVGEPLNTVRSCFDSRFQEAETLWESGAKKGKRTMLINWPVTWPAERTEGVSQIVGSINPPFRFYYLPIFDLSPASVYSTKNLPCDQIPDRVGIVTFQDLELGIKTTEIQVPKNGKFFDGMKHGPKPINGNSHSYQVNWERNNGISQVKILSKASGDKVAVLREGETSDWIKEEYEFDGRIRKGQYRFTLTQASSEEDDFILYASAIATDESLTEPYEFTDDVVKVTGPYWEVDDPWAYLDGWISRETYMQQLKGQIDWWTNANIYALQSANNLDMLFSWIGAIDHGQHVFWGGIDPNFHGYRENKHEEYEGLIRQIYEWVDEGVGKIMDLLDEDTTVVAVSDHGFHSINKYPYLTNHLHKLGLVEYLVDEETGEFVKNPITGDLAIDWSRTKAYPLPPGHSHIFVNLKGRDPEGIVEPEDYEKVQEEIISALLAMRDPETGEQIVSIALKRNEGRTVGIFEGAGYERVGDVLFDMKEGYCANPMVYPAEIKYPDGTSRVIANLEEFEPCELNRHFTGYHLALPAVESMHAALMIAGPGVPKGVEFEQPMNIIDIAPSLARLINIPIPRNAEGLVNHHLFENDEN
ncbi:alkaline phosphatase family protein [Bacillus sp. JJ1521]|uniref:alkaline phosphatase family protein n=1 Tax=Bacillus sp. JJ1521 TaxID=3122957 RepID=UPI0030008994